MRMNSKLLCTNYLDFVFSDAFRPGAGSGSRWQDAVAIRRHLQLFGQTIQYIILLCLPANSHFHLQNWTERTIGRRRRSRSWLEALTTCSPVSPSVVHGKGRNKEGQFSSFHCCHWPYFVAIVSIDCKSDDFFIFRLHSIWGEGCIFALLYQTKYLYSPKYHMSCYKYWCDNIFWTVRQRDDAFQSTWVARQRFQLKKACPFYHVHCLLFSDEFLLISKLRETLCFRRNWWTIWLTRRSSRFSIATRSSWPTMAAASSSAMMWVQCSVENLFENIFSSTSLALPFLIFTSVCACYIFCVLDTL